MRRRAEYALFACIILLVIAATAVAARASASVAPPEFPARVLPDVPRNGWAAAREELAPKGASALRLCRYAGANAPSALKLARSRLVTDPSLLTHLVDELDALPPFPDLPFACPMDDGSQILALLRYPHGQSVTVAFDETGCNRVTNGDVVRIANGYGNAVGPRLVAELKSLTA